MQIEPPTLEYAEGEIFRPRRAFLLPVFVALAALMATTFVSHVWVRLILRRGDPDPVILILLVEAIQLLGVLEIAFIALCIMRAYVQLRKEGIEFRRPVHWQKVRFDWNDVRAVTFVRRGKNLAAMRCEVSGRPKPVRVVIGLYLSDARRRIEAIVRQHVNAEKIQERSVGIDIFPHIRIAIGILGTLLTAFSTWIFLIWLRVPRGFGGLKVTTPFGPITVNRGNFLIPTPFESLPYAGIPVWSLIAFGALLALWGFLAFGKKKTPVLSGFPIDAPQNLNP